MNRIPQPVREALGILLCAAVLGFSYTAVAEKGVFGQPLPASGQSPAMIHIDEAKPLFDAGSAIFIDARHSFDFKLGHIQGAINLPLEEFDNRKDLVASLPRDKTLITYCDGVECNSSIELATKLSGAGFRAVRIFFAGWNDWRSRDYPAEKTAQ